MKFISWNIDGARSILRKGEFMASLVMWRADVYAFQETKLLAQDKRLIIPGYHDYWSFFETGTTLSPQSGTMCLCRKKPKAVYTSFPDEGFDTEGRLIRTYFKW